MTSAVYIFLEAETPASKWETFRRSMGLDEDAMLTGEHRGPGVLVAIDGAVRAAARDPATGLLRTDEDQSDVPFDRITVSGAMGTEAAVSIGIMADCIVKAFPSSIMCDPELDHLVVQLPRQVPLDAGQTPLATDVESAWLESDGIRAARVDAGRAVVKPTSDLLLLEIEGIPRASFRLLQHAIHYAGRCCWLFWEGRLPEGDVPPKLRLVT